MARKPTGEKLTNQVIIRMDDETKDALRKKAEAEGKSVSSVLMSFIRSYLTQAPQPTSTTEPDIFKVQAEIEALKQEMMIMKAELMGK